MVLGCFPMLTSLYGKILVKSIFVNCGGVSKGEKGERHVTVL